VSFVSVSLFITPVHTKRDSTLAHVFVWFICNRADPVVSMQKFEVLNARMELFNRVQSQERLTKTQVRMRV